jgi:predicted LPLAT superfamily acyltransferase
MVDGANWSEIRELGFLSGMRLMFWVYRHIGPWAFTIVLQPVVLYYYVTNRIARESSREFLHRVHSDKGESEKLSWRDVYRHLHSFAQSTVDKLGVWADANRFDVVNFTNRQILLDQLATGKGAILLGAHLGNMEICRSFARANTRLKLNILVHTKHADMFNKLLQELHEHCELELIEVSQLSPATAIRLADCVERGEFIAILADRVPVASRGRSQRVNFFGKKALFPEGPFILACLLKCPVYTLFCTRADTGGYDIRCEEFSKQIRLPRSDREESLNKYITRFAAVLEQNVRRTPLQWFNFYPYWDQEE